VKQNRERYVIKPSGPGGIVKRRLFVGDEDDGEDVIRVLEAYKKSFPDEIKVFQLQRRVTGVEIAVGAFFNGKEFIYPLNVNFEHQKLFPGNVGPSTGEMGTFMFWSGANRLFNSTLKKLETRFAEEGYVGYIDLNCIVNGNGIYPLEFTSRFGYPTISPARGHDHADRPLPCRLSRRDQSKTEGKKRVSDRRSNCCVSLPL
jgi:phosphoribosylamine--glycine ligase